MFTFFCMPASVYRDQQKLRTVNVKCVVLVKIWIVILMF